MWFTEPGIDKIGRITPAGVVTEFGGLSAGSGPQGIVAGWDRSLWFAEAGALRIGRLTTAGAATEALTAPAASPARGLAAGPDGNMWATVGNGVDQVRIADPERTYNLVLPSGFVPAARAVAMGTTVSWLFAAGRAATVNGASGMAAYDSGSRAPGTIFSNPFFAAGTFRYRDTLAPGWTGGISAAPTATPVRGGSTATFTPTWASQAAPAGFVYDVYLAFCAATPCTPAYSAWQTGTTAASGPFSAVDGAWHGPGTYFFESRLRRSANGTHSLFGRSRLTVTS